MSITYVIPDIHGRLDLLERALTQIDRRTQNAKIIFLGDYIDRGPSSAQVIARVRNGINDGRNWVALKGNHEDFMARAICDQECDYSYSWVMNGGAKAIESYGGITETLASDANWCRDLPCFYMDANRVYVHAYAPQNSPIDDEPTDNLMWKRYPQGADIGYMGRHVVHGHTPKKNGPELFKNRTNLDCGGVFWGRLVVGIFDDDTAGGPIDLIEVSA